MLKTSENMEFEYFFQYKAFFHFSSNLHTSCLSTFNPHLFELSWKQINLPPLSPNPILKVGGDTVYTQSTFIFPDYVFLRHSRF